MKRDPRQASRRQAGSPAVTRSPNYPFVDLQTAVDRASAVYAAVDRRPTGRDRVAGFWKLSPKSSTFRLTFAAVRAFGLLENQTRTEDRLLKLSELALDIVADYTKGSPQWWEAMKRAALKPTQHAELWRMYGDDLPDHEKIKRHLVRVRKFRDHAAGELIKEYRSSLSFAGLLRDVDPAAPVKVVEPSALATPSPRTSVPQIDIREDVCTLDEGQAVLRWPGRLSAAGYQDFKDWLDLIARKAKRLVASEFHEAEP